MSILTDIKHRIKGVSETKQITSAMETVSVSKMQKSMVRFESSRIFFEAVKNTINDIVCRTGNIPGFYFSDKPAKHPLYIVIASDKGLAGGFNYNVLKHAWPQIENNENCRIITVGHTAREFFEKKRMEADIDFSGSGADPDKGDAAMIADTVLKLYREGFCDEVNIVYTKMLSSVAMNPETLRLLPFSYSHACKIRDEMSIEREAELRETEYDPSPDEVLEDLVPQYLNWIVYGALIQSAASEHSSRRKAMNNATKNASEILDGLKLEYNRARQEEITNELSEIIVSGIGLNCNKEQP